MKSTETQPSCTVCGDRHAATQCDTVQSLNTLNTIVWENIKYHFAVTIWHFRQWNLLDFSWDDTNSRYRLPYINLVLYNL